MRSHSDQYCILCNIAGIGVWDKWARCTILIAQYTMSPMLSTIDRRAFLTQAGLLAGAAFSSAQPKPRLKIGHTGITWGFKPEDAAVAIHDVSS